MSLELVRQAAQSAYDLPGPFSWKNVDAYIDAHSSDRRYKLHVLAATCGTTRPSAIVRYRGIKIDLYHDYPSGQYTTTRM